MTTRQTNILMFIFTLCISLAFLFALVKVNRSLELSNQAVNNLQRQIDDLRAQDHVTTEQILKITQSTDAINKDLAVTQDLQRKQAIAVGDLKKGKKR